MEFGNELRKRAGIFNHGNGEEQKARSAVLLKLYRSTFDSSGLAPSRIETAIFSRTHHFGDLIQELPLGVNAINNAITSHSYLIELVSRSTCNR